MKNANKSKAVKSNINEVLKAKLVKKPIEGFDSKLLEGPARCN